MFADDTELYNAAPRASTDSLFCNMQNCVSDVKKWTIHNKFRLNGDYTEALLFDPSKSFDPPDVLRIGQSDRPFCYSARNLGVMFDSGLTMKQGSTEFATSHALRSGESALFVISLLLS